MYWKHAATAEKLVVETVKHLLSFKTVAMEVRLRRQTQWQGKK
jgi:hypothetical protein